MSRAAALPAKAACVLLSGGADSTAALHWARGSFAAVRTIAFDYGQPNRSQELPRAELAARAVNVPFARVALVNALGVRAGLLASIADHETADDARINAAFVPARNAVFASTAAAHACAWWPDGPIALVIGATADDALGFPDCRESFFLAMTLALRVGCARDLEVQAPFARKRKADVLRGLDDAGRDAVATSWSCYRPNGPCGRCTACTLRAASFKEAGLADRCGAAARPPGSETRS